MLSTRAKILAVTTLSVSLPEALLLPSPRAVGRVRGRLPGCSAGRRSMPRSVCATARTARTSKFAVTFQA